MVLLRWDFFIPPRRCWASSMLECWTFSCQSASSLTSCDLSKKALTILDLVDRKRSDQPRTSKLSFAWVFRPQPLDLLWCFLGATRLLSEDYCAQYCHCSLSCSQGAVKQLHYLDMLFHKGYTWALALARTDGLAKRSRSHLLCCEPVGLSLISWWTWLWHRRFRRKTPLARQAFILQVAFLF